MVKISDEHKTAILLLRYHTEKPTNEYPVFESYQRVANKLGITLNQVQHICRHHFRKMLKVPV